MPLERENIDYVCANCGYVTEGPHKGETIPNAAHVSQYKGTELSHGAEWGCTNCDFPAQRRREMTGRAYARQQRAALTAPSPAANAVEKTSRYHVATERKRRRMRMWAGIDEIMHDLRKGTQFE